MCGIWGCVSKHKRPFNYSAFCTLGIANDSRGGDSCGIFIDGHYEYGAKAENKLFQNFFIDNDFLTNLKESSIAFGHCRKASIGKIDETTAQPVVITNEDGKVDYVLMHNGTIYNYEDLAKKYIPEINIEGMTDSQVMARIFYCKGYDVLSEYIGAAVFAIADYREKEPKVYLYKGASKKSQYSKEESEERPLYFVINNGQLIFSSIDIYLFALSNGETVWDAGCNCLYEFDGKDLKIAKKILRDKVYQQKPFVWDIPKKKNNYFGFLEDNAYIYNDFISLNHKENLYSLKGKKLHGKIILSKYGGVLSNSSKADICEEIYFWNGVALKNINCYRFLTVLKKEANCKDFDKKFENLIRFLSIDGLYFINNICYKTTTVKDKEPFTGEMRMLTDYSTTEFKDGKIVSTIYSNKTNDAFAPLINTDWDFNFKTVRDECKYLMK